MSKAEKNANMRAVPHSMGQLSQDGIIELLKLDIKKIGKAFKDESEMASKVESAVDSAINKLEILKKLPLQRNLQLSFIADLDVD